MSRTDLILDSARYNRELSHARQALSHQDSQSLPFGRLVGSRPFDVNPQTPRPVFEAWAEPSAPFCPAPQASEYQGFQTPDLMSSPPSNPVPTSGYSLPPPATSSPSQPRGTLPQPSLEPGSFRPPCFAPAVISLLEVMTPLARQVPDAQLLRLVDQVGRVFFNER